MNEFLSNRSGHSPRALLALIGAAIVFALSACSNQQTEVESDLGISGAPDWVNEGSQAVDNNDGQLIHGVGMAPPMNDLSLQKATADNRARAQIANVLSTYINSTMHDYTASAGKSADMNVEREIASTTQLALNGARILGRWKNDDNGNIYAFAELNLETLDELVATAKGLSQSFKDYYQQNANSSFERFISTQPAGKPEAQ
ncbi:MAG: hypothetical protein GY813_03455 [Halieaceae bacterium]|nr:hypothetical protein [Halieaceae bacterium]